ncbi:hypothetical protein MLD38_015959 [Melastoma candidum]|uniref:Uncharacterized protein n=1 Tax=Melastoma candidum TaxID=119954 RepID=A0ACB9RKX3_9MYRT|nr:hypothetical protein MLD38_015959 [Melastoma candidum]
MLIVVRVHLSSEIPIVGYELTPYVLLRRSDKIVFTDDVVESAPVDGCFLRYKWYRIQSDKKVSVRSIHPLELATLQCIGQGVWKAKEHYACNSQHEMDKVRASMERRRTDLLYEMNLMGMKIDKLADVLNARLEANEREFRAEIGMTRAEIGTTRAEIGTMKAELIAKLEGARQEIRSATSSMTSLPKPLKFLRPHYGTLKAYYETMPESDLKSYLADILSVLALTMSAEGERKSLKYRLLGSRGDIGSWGHEYVRNFAGEISQEYTKRQGEEASVNDLMELVQQIVAFHMQHNAEPEAVDLLLEVENLEILMEHIDTANFKRTCLYLTSAARYLPGPDDVEVLRIAYKIYLRFKEYAKAIQIALFLDDMAKVKEVFTSCDDLLQKKQFCYILARHTGESIIFKLYGCTCSIFAFPRRATYEVEEEMVADDDDREVLQGIVNNSKLSEGYLTLARDVVVMEAKSPEDIYKVIRDGRASAGARFEQDKLMTVQSDSSTSGSSGNWLFKNKDHGKASAAASLLASSIATSRMTVILLLTSCTVNYIYSDEREESDLGEPLVRLLPLALGLLYLGKQESVEVTAEVAKTFNEKIRKHCEMTLLSCAYAGTGNVLKIQNLLGHCAQHLEKGETHQGPAVLGIALVAMAEELGLDMAIRSLEHLLQYGEQNIRRAVPLALGLLCISNPKVNVMDMLSRLSHDSEVAMAAVISLGLIGAGTNNARIAGLLRNLSSYYYRDASLLFCVRIAQGLVHLGKGLLTLNPYHSERFLLSPTALAGLNSTLHTCHYPGEISLRSLLYRLGHAGLLS